MTIPPFPAHADYSGLHLSRQFAEVSNSYSSRLKPFVVTGTR